MRLVDTDGLEIDMAEEMFDGDGDYKIFGYSKRQIDAAPTIASQPNDPLTLEELREMDGEPVWVAEEQRYGILEVGDDNFVVTLDHLKWGIVCPVQTENRVGGMTFYRRRPEEGDGDDRV